MNTAGSEVHLYFSFRLQVFRIKLDLMILLLSFGLHQEWVAKIVIMKMKRRLIVPISIGFHDLTVGDLGVLHQDIDIGAAFSIGVTDEPFDREPVVGFVRRRNNRSEAAQHNYSYHGGKYAPPQLNPSCLVAPHVRNVTDFLPVSFRLLPHTTEHPA